MIDRNIHFLCLCFLSAILLSFGLFIPMRRSLKVHRPQTRATLNSFPLCPPLPQGPDARRGQTPFRRSCGTAATLPGSLPPPSGKSSQALWPSVCLSFTFFLLDRYSRQSPHPGSETGTSDSPGTMCCAHRHPSCYRHPDARNMPERKLGQTAALDLLGWE
jgi:hypothetical protein